jgi:hypothetical protein
MIDHNTRQRQNELNAWQKASINQILGASDPILPTGAVWHAIEYVMMLLGLFGIGLVALWLVAAFAGFYFEMVTSGFAFGRGVFGWLAGVGR